MVWDIWSETAGLRQLVLDRWSETAGFRQMVWDRWSETSGLRQLVLDSWSETAGLQDVKEVWGSDSDCGRLHPLLAVLNAAEISVFNRLSCIVLAQDAKLGTSEECLLVGCLTFQQHASVSLWRTSGEICSLCSFYLRLSLKKWSTTSQSPVWARKLGAVIWQFGSMWYFNLWQRPFISVPSEMKRFHDYDYAE